MIHKHSFTFVQAEGPSLKSRAFRLRYHVYCEEKRWLDPRNYPEMQESDAYDEHSVHFLAMNSDDAVGAIRLIINEQGSALPIGLNFKTEMQAYDNSCEISRMVIPKEQRKGNIAIGLMRILFRYVLEHKDELDNVYIAVEDRFLLSISMLGFEFKPIGPPAFCCGDVLIPAKLKVNELEQSLKSNNMRFYEWLMGDPHKIAADGGNLLGIYSRTGRANTKGGISKS